LRRLARLLVVVILAGGSAAFQTGLVAGSPPVTDVGNVDFIQYWAAHRLMRAGQDPYDSRLVLALERAQGLPGTEPQLGWNPPWLVTMMSPILALPMRASAMLWLGINIVFALLIGLLTTRTYRGGAAMRPALLPAFFLFLPLIVNLHFGQVGLLLALSAAAFLYLVQRRRDFWGGLLLVPLTVKPHLTYLLVPLLVYWTLAGRRWRAPLGLLLGFVVLVACTNVRYPGSISAWMTGMQTRAPTAYVAATLVGMVRLLLVFVTGQLPRWPLVAIPGIALIAATVWLLWRRPRPDLRRLLPPLLALSLFTSPYGWLFDQCLLLPTQVALVALAFRNEVKPRPRAAVLIAVVGVQLGMLVQRALGVTGMHYYFWVPLVLFLIWQYCTKRYDLLEAEPRAIAPGPG
jgi:hypothetical protein